MQLTLPLHAIKNYFLISKKKIKASKINTTWISKRWWLYLNNFALALFTLSAFWIFIYTIFTLNNYLWSQIRILLFKLLKDKYVQRKLTRRKKKIQQQKQLASCSHSLIIRSHCYSKKKGMLDYKYPVMPPVFITMEYLITKQGRCSYITNKSHSILSYWID